MMVWRSLLESEKKGALLIGTYGQGEKNLCEEHLEELASLCITFGVETKARLPSPLREISPATFLGKGKVEEIRLLAQELNVEIIVFDDEISPQQQKNLEKLLAIPVIDRTELILGVFAQRARTREAKLQVELASIEYQLPRLRRLWTHLSRQRTGGASGGFLKGEGEKQIEIDRRLLRKKIDRVKEELAEVKKQRAQQRRAREREGLPTFAIIGYTNAGKSTLMHSLTEADVLVEDKLFATLDPTVRKFFLPNNQAILLIDTVGFIRKIPHQLIAAFKSTLEEAVGADILLHLIDVSHPAARSQAEETLKVLKELGGAHLPMITLLNKVDRCKSRLEIDRLRFLYPKTVEVSALQRQGFDLLLELMMKETASLRKQLHLRIPQDHYHLLAKALEGGKILSMEYEENDILVDLEIPYSLEHKLIQYEIQSGNARLPNESV
ncbi:MAG: GTPase HflX [Verrucomicrobiota bacterium]|nr:GTPase HflX [Verrucomicrobiota bacterium]